MSDITYVPDAIAEQWGDDWQDKLSGELAAGWLPLNARSNGLANSLVIKSGPGKLFGLSVYSNKAAAQFIQLFDLQTLPADGAVPDVPFIVQLTANLGVNYLWPGRTFTRGIIVCNSSTVATKTIGAADCWFDAQYI